MLKLVDTVLSFVRGAERRVRAFDYRTLDDRRAALKRHDLFGLDEVAATPPLTDGASVLIFKPDEVGDFICALPAVTALKQHRPSLRLYVVCQKHVAPLAAATGLFEGVFGAEIQYRFARFPVWNPKEVASRFGLRDFDCAIYMRTGPNFFGSFLEIPSRAIVHPLDPRLPSKSPYRYGVASTAARTHTVMQLLQLVAPLLGRAVTTSDIAFPSFDFTSKDREHVDALRPPGRFVAVHPFCRYETRRYPLEYWEAIWQRLSARDLPVVIVGGKEDGAVPDRAHVTQLQGKLNIAQTAYLLSRSAAFLGVDSGPGHIAAAQSVPVFTLFGGMSYPQEWAPIGARVLRADVPCAPCERRACPGYGLVCMTSLTPEIVWPRIEAFLAEAGVFAAAVPRPVTATD